MSKNSDLKTCRFVNCSHDNKDIDITKDEYVNPKKGWYYHPDCFQQYKQNTRKNAQTRADLQYIKNQWSMCINRDVVFGHLMKVLNEFLAQGLTSEYLVFALDYVIKHNLKLNYPNGFKYYVEDARIKAAYRRSKLEKIDQSQFTVESADEAPKKVEPSPLIANRPQGFGSILRHKKD